MKSSIKYCIVVPTQLHVQQSAMPSTPTDMQLCAHSQLYP